MELNEEGNLRGLVRLVLRHWKLSAVSILLGAVFGIVHFVFSDRVYESETVIEPARDADDSLADISALTSQLGSVASLAGLSPSRGSRYDQAVALLTSEGFFESFDRRVGFREAIGTRQSSAFLPWQRSAEPMTVRQAHAQFHGEYFRLVEDPTTSVVWLRVRSWDPQLAAVWANELVHAVNHAASERDKALAEKTLNVLEAERTKTQRIETQLAISALMRREAERLMLANISQNYAFNVIDVAHPGDTRDFVSPQLPVSVILGLALGVLVAVSLITVRYRA